MQPPATSRTENPFALRDATAFTHVHITRVVTLSLLLLIPCVWHRHIQAGDLGSHVYNSWLAQLIAQDKAPGLYLAHQWNNILFDLALSWAAKIMGFHAAEIVVVYLAVLIFFWGVFSFVTTVAGRAAWALALCIAMLAFGYSFSMGFLNYYLSIGLSCFVLATVWRGGARNWLTALPVSMLIWMAHPIGFCWLVGTILYVKLWRLLPEYWRLLIPLFVLAGFIAMRWFLAGSDKFDADWRADPFYWMNGSDQLMLYGFRYLVLARAVLAWGALCFACELARSLRSNPQKTKLLRLPVELYVIAFLAAAFIPENIHSDLFAGWIGLLVSRLTTVTAIFGLCALAVFPMRRWQVVGFALSAALFFTFLYQDTARLTRLEANAQAIVATLPAGTRVVPVVSAPGDWRVQFVAHSVERACVYRCFSFSNYEPSSGQFRVRVMAGSPVVTDSADKSEDMASGDYLVQPADLPLVSIYQCDDSDWTTLCAAPLAAGQKTEDPLSPDPR